MAAQRNLTLSGEREERASKALSSGSRLTSAGDDAAAFAISESLRAQVHSLGAAKNNAEAAQGFLQVAEGGLNEQNNILIRMRELAMQAASDTVGDQERGFLNTEFTQLGQEVDRIAKTTVFGDKKLLAAENKTYDFHLGTGSSSDDVVSFTLDADTRGSTLGVSDMTVTDRDDASSHLPDIDAAIQKISAARSAFGAAQSRFEHASSNLDGQRENIEAARSRIADADVAFEASELAQGRLLQEFGAAVLAQANQAPQRALRLLG
jgi:flagellin